MTARCRLIDTAHSFPSHFVKEQYDFHLVTLEF